MPDLRRTRSLIRENRERTYRLKDISAVMDGQPHPKTVYLWCKRVAKKRRVCLEYVETPAGIMTSWEAYQRFLDALESERNRRK